MFGCVSNGTVAALSKLPNLRDDKINRDGIIHTCTLVASDINRDPGEDLDELHRLEDYWTAIVYRERLVSKSGCRLAASMLLLVILGSVVGWCW